jgi:magnesium transporter
MKAEEAIAQEFLRSHPVEAARVLESVTVEDMAALLESGGRGGTVAVLQIIESSKGAECLALWSDEFVTEVLKSLPISYCARMLRLMDSSDRQRILNLASPETAQDLGMLLHYPEGTAASRMNPRYLAYPQDLHVAETWKRLRRRHRRSGFYVYVVDLEGVLVGAIGFNALLSADPRRSLREIMSTPVVSMSALVSSEAILEHPGWARFPDLPVVDESGVLLGSIRYSAFKELELEQKDGRTWAVWNVAVLFGELYWSGSSQLLRGLAESVLTISAGSDIEEKSNEV